MQERFLHHFRLRQRIISSRGESVDEIPQMVELAGEFAEIRRFDFGENRDGVEIGAEGQAEFEPTDGVDLGRALAAAASAKPPYARVQRRLLERRICEYKRGFG